MCIFIRVRVNHSLTNNVPHRSILTPIVQSSVITVYHVRADAATIVQILRQAASMGRIEEEENKVKIRDHEKRFL